MKQQNFLMGFLVLAVFGVIGCDLVGGTKKVSSTKTEKPAVAALPVAGLSTAADDKPLAAGVLAKVGDWSITKSEFDERVKNVTAMVKDFDAKDANSRAMLLNELVRQQLLIQQARQEKLQETTEFKSAMKDFEHTVLVQEIVARLTKDLVVTEEEAKKYYDDNPSEFTKPLEKQLREIVVTTQAEANEILVQVLQGSDFIQLAKEKSKAASKDNGGDLGFKMEAPFAAMATAVATLKKGGVSAVFEGPEGFYVVKVEDIRGGEIVALDDVKADLIKFLTMRKQQQALADKINDITRQIKVQVNENLLKEGTGE